MFIWPTGEVTGSVSVTDLEAFREAQAKGQPLDDWARFFPEGVTAKDFPKPKASAKKEEPEPKPEPKSRTRASGPDDSKKA